MIMKKIITLLLGMLAVLGFSYGSINASTQQERKIEQLTANTPLYLTSPIDISPAISWHESHYSHSSHESHYSHYSHGSHYSGW
jgi:hypothetical protein